MKKLFVFMAVLAVSASPALAGIGDWWVMPIDRIDNQGFFTTHAGAGLGGTDAYEGNGQDGVARIWWDTNNVSSSSGAAMPATLESFTVEAWGPTAGALDWQPIQVQINGYNGPVNFPIDPEIPWAGQFGTNHEWIGGGATAGQWSQHGPGPQTHDGLAEVYIKDGSVLYAKWDFGFPINRSWSAVRITQVTPEPTGALLLLAGAPLILRRKRRA